MSETPEIAPDRARDTKASRVQVFQAADRLLKSGHRPTVEGIRGVLGGGSPNAVVAYLNEWYGELGERLAAVEHPLAGVPAEATALLQELWRLAVKPRGGAASSDADPGMRRMLEAERGSLRAENKAFELLNQELQRHRTSAERSLAEARALLSRREALLEDERAARTQMEQELARVRMELEVLRERRVATASVSKARRMTPTSSKPSTISVRRTPRPVKRINARRVPTRTLARALPKRETRVKESSASKRAVKRTALRANSTQNRLLQVPGKGAKRR